MRFIISSIQRCVRMCILANNMRMRPSRVGMVENGQFHVDVQRRSIPVQGAEVEGFKNQSDQFTHVRVRMGFAGLDDGLVAVGNHGILRKVDQRLLVGLQFAAVFLDTRRTSRHHHNCTYALLYNTKRVDDIFKLVKTNE